MKIVLDLTKDEISMLEEMVAGYCDLGSCEEGYQSDELEKLAKKIEQACLSMNILFKEK